MKGANADRVLKKDENRSLSDAKNLLLYLHAAKVVQLMKASFPSWPAEQTITNLPKFKSTQFLDSSYRKANKEQ